MDLFLQQGSFLGQVLNLYKGVPHRDKVLPISSPSFLCLRTPLNFLCTFNSPGFYLEATSSRLPAHDTSVLSQDTLIFLLKGALHFPFFVPSVQVHLRWYFPGNCILPFNSLVLRHLLTWMFYFRVRELFVLF